MRGFKPRPEQARPERTPVGTRAYNELRRRILCGELDRGSVLNEVETANLLGMSRTPVREAMRDLLNEGLCEEGQRRQMLVAAPSADVSREVALLQGGSSEGGRPPRRDHRCHRGGGPRPSRAGNGTAPRGLGRRQLTGVIASQRKSVDPFYVVLKRVAQDPESRDWEPKALHLRLPVPRRLQTPPLEIAGPTTAGRRKRRRARRAARAGIPFELSRRRGR